MLTDHDFKPLYNSLRDDVVGSFYEPALSECKLYKRASAYFDSNILSLYSTGIENIIRNDGRIRFVFSCDLTEHDYQIMKEGYDLRAKLEANLLRRIETPSPSDELKNLAYLIALGYVDIKIAFTSCGIFHDKFGLVYDGGGNVLCFRGSNNETSASAEANSESFDTTCSWNASERDLEKIRMTEEQFDLLWNNNFPKTIVLDLPTVVKEKLLSFGDGKIHVRPQNKVNSVWFSITNENALFAENNLFQPEKLTGGQFFQQRIMPDVAAINGRLIWFKKDLSLNDFQRILGYVQKMADRFGFDYAISPELQAFFNAYKLKMANLRALGIAIKRHSDFLLPDFEEFKEIVNSLVARPLVEPQLWGAYQIVKMKRAANFSVPGAGKTAIVLGAFAFLRHIGAVDKIVAIGPLNSFISWKNEFRMVFGNKLKLSVFDYQVDKMSTPSRNRYDAIVSRAADANLCLFNYEALPNAQFALTRLINGKTLLVFDEVHRIKSVGGVRAAAALTISGTFGAQYRVVLTGTPIPNGFQDSYNFLHILFGQSYDDYFGLEPRELNACNANLVEQADFNDKIFPFFSVINKQQLQVPPPDPDDFETGYCLAGEKEEKLFEIVRLRTYGSTLLTYIRLMEASCNPGLILHRASIAAEQIFLDSVDHDYEEDDFPDDHEREFSGFVEEYTPEEVEFISNFGMTEKYYRGIQIVSDEVDKGKHVLCWGLFIDTLYKIKASLAEKGITSEVICGTVALSERERIIADFQAGRIDVLIANPATLAESVSLHKNCHVAVYFEYSFNLVHMLQSKDRIHRLGLPQGTQTHYYFMIEDNPDAEFQCIDKLILDRLSEKANRQFEFLNNEGLSYEGMDLLEEIGDIVYFKKTK